MTVRREGIDAGALVGVMRESQRFDDERWAADGFGDVAESRAWSDRACGLACVRMVLRHFGCPVPAQSELLWAGLRLSAYCSAGWVHAGLVQLSGAYGLSGFASGDVAVRQLEHAVGLGVPPIVSVARTFPGGRRGGHLVVFCGTSRSGGDAWAHFRDPSRWGETNDRVELARFEEGFAGRALFLWPREWNVAEAVVTGVTV